MPASHLAPLIVAVVLVASLPLVSSATTRALVAFISGLAAGLGAMLLWEDTKHG